MQHFAMLLCLILFCGFTQAQVRGIPRVLQSEIAIGEKGELCTERYAFLTSFSDYTQCPQLSSVPIELDRVDKALKDQKSTLVQLNNLIERELANGLEDIFNQSCHDCKNRSLIYYSGNGQVMNIAPSYRMGVELDKGKSYANLATRESYLKKRYMIRLAQMNQTEDIVLERLREAEAYEKFDDIDFGRYYAILIGSNTYPNLGDLETAVNDVRAIDRLLRERYGFETQILINASRYEILSALNQARKSLLPQDNLIIYYAGRGQLLNETGYWLPVDAEADSDVNWIHNSTITKYVETIQAKHILVVADTSFSGTFSRAFAPRMTPKISSSVRHDWLKDMASSKARIVLSSGGIKPVYDRLNGTNHSLFATAFIDKLKHNSVVLDGYSLFSALQAQVKTAAKALGLDQTPLYSPIQFAGHDGGDFLFVPVQR